MVMTCPSQHNWTNQETSAAAEDRTTSPMHQDYGTVIKATPSTFKFIRYKGAFTLSMPIIAECSISQVDCLAPY
jgi:hypothetical protein